MKERIIIAISSLVIIFFTSVLTFALSNYLDYRTKFAFVPMHIWYAERFGQLGSQPILWDTAATRRVAEKEITLHARTAGNGFQIYRHGAWQDIFIRGVNTGFARPGKWFTQFPENWQDYYRWFKQIGGMYANCVRVYTLMPPPFYHALAYYNRTHPNHPIFLLQEIWPEEYPPGEDCLARKYVSDYQKEIRYAVDAIHGNVRIPSRKYRAYGNYATDVSPYVLGFLIGREMEPHEVLSTNEKNTGYTFQGQFIQSAPGASPTETWLAMNCDYVLAYEEQKYRCQHPVAIVNWPTLDPLDHWAEWNHETGKKDFNDQATVDIRHFETTPRVKAGFFGAYHIYPNYPDFMNTEPAYDAYSDDEGRLRYGGYLREFMAVHGKYPALIAEFGLATGMASAHDNPDGYNHGGLSELAQGEGVVRMLAAIRREGFAGGVIFEWMDEWAKKTWTTEPYMIPYEHKVFWHNAIDPEQNYGIVAVEPLKPSGAPTYRFRQDSRIQQVKMSYDAAFVYIEIDFDILPDFSIEHLLVGIDTYNRELGEFRYAPYLKTAAPSGMEFLLEFSGDSTARLLAIPSYNTGTAGYISKLSANGVFEEIRILINKYRRLPNGREIKPIYFNASALEYGSLENNSLAHWIITRKSIHVRLPWARLNFSDPSSKKVLHDRRQIAYPGKDQLNITDCDGIVVTALLCNRQKTIVHSSFGLDGATLRRPFTWHKWEIPPFRERLKQSYYVIKNYFGKLAAEQGF